jgi:hypothetical protein
MVSVSKIYRGLKFFKIFLTVKQKKPPDGRLGFMTVLVL